MSVWVHDGTPASDAVGSPHKCQVCPRQLLFSVWNLDVNTESKFLFNSWGHKTKHIRRHGPNQDDSNGRSWFLHVRRMQEILTQTQKEKCWQCRHSNVQFHWDGWLVAYEETTKAKKGFTLLSRFGCMRSPKLAVAIAWLWILALARQPGPGKGSIFVMVKRIGHVICCVGFIWGQAGHMLNKGGTRLG